jgi:hypothetical protein
MLSGVTKTEQSGAGAAAMYASLRQTRNATVQTRSENHHQTFVPIGGDVTQVPILFLVVEQM